MILSRETSLNIAVVSTSVSDPSTTHSTPPAGKAGGNGARRSARNHKMPIWMTVVIGIVISLIALMIVRTQGYVAGREFSPTHFQARDFHFYEIPLLHIQITPIRRSSATPPVATYLRQKGLIGNVPNGPPTQWHLVHLSRGIGANKPADAQLLMNQFSLDQSSTPYWRSWSEEYPEYAKRLWPVIGRLAERELYVLMPGLLELAQQAESPEDLSTRIDERLCREYAQLIQDMIDAGRDELAERLHAEAIEDYPDDAGLKSLSLPPPSTNRQKSTSDTQP